MARQTDGLRPVGLTLFDVASKQGHGYKARLPGSLSTDAGVSEDAADYRVCAEGAVEGGWMLAKPLLSEILANDAVTRGLGDPEARILVEWLVERTEQLAEVADCEIGARREVQRLCRRARAIARFVLLWGQARERGAACQLAAAERFTWPLPATAEDPCELMQFILDWETRQLAG